jgi:hypothetical protein
MLRKTRSFKASLSGSNVQFSQVDAFRGSFRKFRYSPLPRSTSLTAESSETSCWLEDVSNELIIKTGLLFFALSCQIATGAEVFTI